jgi:hypothetical protein
MRGVPPKRRRDGRDLEQCDWAPVIREVAGWFRTCLSSDDPAALGTYGDHLSISSRFPRLVTSSTAKPISE